MPLLAVLGQAAAELTFYVLVGVWWLLTVQYDIVDRWLGSPNLNRVGLWHIEPLACAPVERHPSAY